MTKSNAAITSNVTEFIQSTDNLHEAIDALHSAQISGGEYRYTALAMAGALITEINIVFPMHMALIFMATSAKRRQVWFSHLSSVYANPDNPQPIPNPDALRKKLLNISSKELLYEAYGTVPDGYISALERLGLNGKEPRIYLLMHKFMSESATLRKSFSHASKIKASTITTLAALPVPLQSYDLADQIVDPKDIKTLTFIINTLARDDDEKYSEICSNVVNAAKQGHSVSAVLKREYYLTRFPESAVDDTEFCKHISNAFELKKAAHQFSNCLRDYCESGIRGEYQYFRIFENNRCAAIVSLREDIPFGFRIDEIFGKRNEYIGDELEQKIIKHFEKHGVYKMSSMEALLRELGMLNRGGRRNPVDDINMYIDELLEDGPI